MMKKCSKCKEVKPYSDFHKDKTGKDGLRANCKDCNKQYYQENKEKIKQYQEENKEKLKQYREENKERRKQYHKQYREENKEKIKQRDKQYYKENIDRIKQYREENKEKIKQRHKQYREENKERRKQQSKQWRVENKEKIKQWSKQYREENKEKIKQYREENKEMKKQRDKQYREENIDRIKQYREENKEKIKQRHKQYREENKERINEYFKQRIKTDPIFRLSRNTRSSIRNLLKNKGYSKKTNTYKILGLEYQDFYTWLNTEASNGLNFDRDDVHVDHVIPVSFGKTEEQILALNHYSNLQLLTSEENLNKHNTYIKQSNLDRVMKHHPNNPLLTKILLNYDYLIF